MCNKFFVVSTFNNMVAWPNLLPFLYQQLDSTNSNAVEGTLYTLSILCERLEWRNGTKPELGRTCRGILFPNLLVFSIPQMVRLVFCLFLYVR